MVKVIRNKKILDLTQPKTLTKYKVRLILMQRAMLHILLSSLLHPSAQEISIDSLLSSLIIPMGSRTWPTFSLTHLRPFSGIQFCVILFNFLTRLSNILVVGPVKA